MNSKESSALVYVIIVTYNGLKWIDQCLQSLQESDYSHRVLIVDNCSTDNTVQHVKDKYPEVTFLIQDRNLGFGKANNIGLRYALTHGGEYFLLLNQDAYVAHDTISKLADAFKNTDGQTGLISPVHKAKDGRLDFGFKDHIMRYAPESSKEAILQGDVGLYETGFVNAACWMLSRNAVKTVGGFNPLFPHYGEDNDFVNRHAFHGLQVKVLNSTYVIHDREQKHSDSFSKMKKREEVAFLKHLANINFTFSSAWATVFKKYIKEVIYYFFTFSWNRVLAIKLAFLKVTSMFRSIKKSRLESKKEGAYL